MSSHPPTFEESISELKQVLDAAGMLSPVITEAGRAMILCLKNGGRILTCGNGGSAADAMHLAEELV